MSQDLSAGIVCFEVAGMTPRQVIERLRQGKIIGSVTPYATQYARVAPSLLTSSQDIDQALTEILRLKA
jgi:selenocysteine lyase/cysteine desulfurase